MFIPELEGSVLLVYRAGKDTKGMKSSFVDDGDGFEARLDPKEYQNFVWATKKDVEDGRCGEVSLSFATADQRQAVLDAFQWCGTDCMW